MIDMHEVYNDSSLRYLKSLNLGELEEVVYCISEDIETLSKCIHHFKIKEDVIKQLKDKKLEVIGIMRGKLDSLYVQSTCYATQCGKATGENSSRTSEDVSSPEERVEYVPLGFDGFGRVVVMKVEKN